MTLRHLRIFVAVCTYGSITKAATHLHMAQPSVSLAIAELEQYYHIKLFDRISRKLYITEDGKRFLTYASQITSMFEEMEAEIHDWKGQEELHIGSSITIANTLLCDCLNHYQEQYNCHNVQVFICNSSNLEDKVLHNELDLALIEGVPHHPDLLKQAFFQDELVVLCAKNHPLTQYDSIELSTLLEQPLLLREKGSGTRDILDSIMQIHNVSLHPIWESASTQALVKGVQNNFGLSILPYHMVKQELHAGHINRLHVKDLSLQREYYIIYHKNKYHNVSMTDFINTCMETVRRKRK